jgi:hypothetical protein
MQRKTWYSIFGVDAMPLSLKNLLLNWAFLNPDSTKPLSFCSKNHLMTNIIEKTILILAGNLNLGCM